MKRAMNTSPPKEIRSRERIRTVLNGEEPDRLPVWLKIGSDWYPRQNGPLRGMSTVEILRALGCDPVLQTGYNFVTKYAAGVTLEVSGERNGRQITRISTPDGPLFGEERRYHPTRYLVDSTETLRRLRWLYTGTEYEPDPESKAKVHHWFYTRKEEDVFLIVGHVITPLMMLVRYIAGPENTVYLLHDEPELFRETMEIMRQDRLRFLRSILPHYPTDMFKLAEDTSTNLISPSMFDEFCMPVLTDYADIAMEHGMIPVHHMCGLIGDLLERIDSLPALVNEAFTTRPVGDVSLAEGRARMPSKVLLGGTNAALWMRPAGEIVETVNRDLTACDDRRMILLTSGGGLPPEVPFQKARQVVEAFKYLPV